MSTPLTTTSYAVLALLGLGPATSYELAKQVQRSLKYFWPRADRKLYEEPKRLVVAGYATATEEAMGRRTRTMYTITDTGRGALRDWLALAPAAPSVEAEAVVKAFFAEHGSRADLLSSLAAVRSEAAARRHELAGLALQTLAPDAPYPERLHVNALAMRFAVEFADLMDRWAAWAADAVESWEDAAGPDEGWRDQAMAVFQDAMRITPETRQR